MRVCAAPRAAACAAAAAAVQYKLHTCARVRAHSTICYWKIGLEQVHRRRLRRHAKHVQTARAGAYGACLPKMAAAAFCSPHTRAVFGLLGVATPCWGITYCLGGGGGGAVPSRRVWAPLGGIGFLSVCGDECAMNRVCVTD